MTQTRLSPSCDLMEVHKQPCICQSVSPEVREDATASPNDDFQDLRIAAVALGDPSDEMLRISDGLRSFVEKGQNRSEFSIAQVLYDRGLARSTTGNMAFRGRQTLVEFLRPEIPTDRRQQFKSSGTNTGQDANEIPVIEHEAGEYMRNNASINRLLKLSEEFAKCFDHSTPHTDPRSSQKEDFNSKLAGRNLLRQTRLDPTVVGKLLKVLDTIDNHYDPAWKAAHMRREIEINVFYDSFHFLYRIAPSASNDDQTSAKARKKTKKPKHMETVEELQGRILQQATAIQDNCAVLLSYLNWINWEKAWGLLDEGRYKAHYLVRRLIKLVEDDPVPQSILEALDSPATCATLLSSGEPHTIAIDRALGQDDSSKGQEPSTLEDMLRQALNQMRKTISESEGSAKVKDINKSRSRKLMRMILSSNVLATFSEDMSKAVDDLFLAFTILNTMRTDLYNIRKQARTAVITWTRASYKAWFIGYINWHEIPITQKYEQQRIEYLAMCENAKILHEKLAPRLRILQGNRSRGELPRVYASKASSDAEKRCNRVRKSWRIHIRVFRHMFPQVTNMIWEAGALVSRAARSETHDLDTQQELEARLRYWKSLDENDCMADEEGKEYWDILLPCTECS